MMTIANTDGLCTGKLESKSKTSQREIISVLSCTFPFIVTI